MGLPIIRKLVRWQKWSGAHTENILKELPSHLIGSKVTKQALKELEKDIYSTGFYHNKAKNIKNCCKELIDKHNGKVPADFEALCNYGVVIS